MKRVVRIPEIVVALAAAVVLAGCAGGPRPNRPAPPAPQPAPQQPAPDQGRTQPLPQSQRDTPRVPADRGAPQAPRSTEQPTPPSQQREPATASRPAPPRDPAAVSSPAVMSLMGRADTLANNGSMDDAAATLERALDLEPRNPFIYQRLAAVRLAQGQASQAEQIALKSNSVAGDNPFIEAGNWQVIAEARKAAGDMRGANTAESKAVNYRRSVSDRSQ